MLPFRSGRSGNWGFAVRPLSILLMWTAFALEPAMAAKPKGRKKEKLLSATPSASAGEQSLTNIPLPIGHEAKGLVLPDFDLEGHLRGRFEAASAKRIDEENIGFHSLKITTYTPENKADLTIELIDSVLNLKTRILSSKERTIIQRADFNIAGDSVEFDTNTHTGKLVGNVKMVLTSQSQLLGNQNE
jgi:lipopolysaccharide assembly outer membrane protein LptD (OstA)